MQVSAIKKNIAFGIFYFAIVNLLKFIVRLVFVRSLAVEYLGLNGLFTNILSMLCLTEMGVGSAIVYSLYKPLAIGDRELVKSLMDIFRRAYTAIGIVIFVLGLCLFPWLEFFVKAKPDIDNWQYFYLFFLLNTSVSYFWSYQRNLLIADQKEYIVNIYLSCINVVVALVQIFALWLWKSYYFYLAIMLIGTVLENVLVSNKAYRVYPYLKQKAIRLDSSVKQHIITNIKALLIHKFAAIIVFTSSNLIISKFVGLVTVGMYSNYALVVAGLQSLGGKMFSAATASVGHAMVLDDLQQKIRFFKRIELATAWQASMFTVGIYVLINPFIQLWLGKEYLFDNDIVMLLSISFYLHYMRKPVLMYRDACGLFKQDRYKAIIETIINFVASLWLVQAHGLKGVLLGGILSTVLTCVWLEPFVLFRYGFPYSLRSYFKEYLKYTFITMIFAIGFKSVGLSFDNNPGILCSFVFLIPAVLSAVYYYLYGKFVLE